MQAAAQPAWVHWIPLLVIAAVLALRWRRMSRSRRLSLSSLWVLPAVYAAGLVVVFAEAPPRPIDWMWSVAALGAGAAIGWQRGRMMHIAVDPDTRALSQRGSPAAFVLLILLIAARSLARSAFAGSQVPGLGLATEIALAFGFGLVAATRLEMGLRARRLLTSARV